MYKKVSKKQKSVLAPINLFFLYVLCTFIVQPLAISGDFTRISMWATIGAAFFISILKIRSNLIRPYTIWYSTIVFLSFVSCLYSYSVSASLKSVYSMIVTLILTFSITILVTSPQEIVKVIKMFALSGETLFIVLYSKGLLANEIEGYNRLGDEVFGNSNIFAMLVMLSLICSIWIVVYGSKKEKWIFSIFSISQLYMMMLSGGRKYIIISLVFFYLVLILKKDRKDKSNVVKYTVLIGIIVWIVYRIIMHVPELYDVIGFRVEMMLKVLTGESSAVYESDAIRLNMINYGMEYFAMHPILGWGQNSFSVLFGYQTGFFAYAHNNYVELLVNLGIIGFSFYYVFYVYLFIKIRRCKNVDSSIRNFFIALLICIPLLEMGIVSYYSQNLLQIFVCLASLLVGFNEVKRSRNTNE